MIQGSDNSLWGVTIKGLVYDGTKLYAGALINPSMPGQMGPHALLEIDPTTLTPVGTPTYITGTVHTLAGLNLGGNGRSGAGCADSDVRSFAVCFRAKALAEGRAPHPD